MITRFSTLESVLPNFYAGILKIQRVKCSNGFCHDYVVNVGVVTYYIMYISTAPAKDVDYSNNPQLH